MTRKEFNQLKELLEPIRETWNSEEKLKYRLNELGKIEQTTTGTGHIYDPIKYWVEGMEVEEGKWYQCYDMSGYLWEAKKTGVPTSDLDEEFFDVVGV